MTSFQNRKYFIDKLFKRCYLMDIDINEFADEAIFDKAFEIFQTDYERYFENEEITETKLFSRLELIGILLYRLAREYFLEGNENFANHLSNLGRMISGFEIYYSANIGKGLKINHGLGTVIGARSFIGENALIHQGVTFGDRNGGRPVLLDNVTVFAGAKILGGIVCGNNSIIAANCVCLIDVPENSVIAGVPGKIKKQNVT